MNLVLIMATKNVFINLLRLVCAFFDMIIYTIAAIILRIIFQLANFELTGFYESIENRVYVILGIFMLFKITISLITYLVNPDKINDKEQGMSKVVTRIITVLVMLIMLPSFFSFMTEFQNKLLPVVPRIIVGTANTLNSEDVYYISENMSITMMRAFLRKSSDDCDGSEISALPDILDNVNDACSSDKNKMYRYDYLYGISTIVGIAMCYCLFSMAIQVSIRAIKLIILRMMAPIPVISYIDPKSSKDGAFSHWVKTFMTTWGELFINLGILYFIVYIVEFMLTKDAWRGFFASTSGNGVLSVWDSTMLLSFLIVGLFFFGKSAPKFIFDALGIKDKGNFVRMLGMGATAVGGIGAMRSTLRARNEYDSENRAKGATFSRKAVNLGKSLFSGLGAIGAGGNALLSADKPTLLTGFDAQAKHNATALSRINAGSTVGGRGAARMQMLFGGETRYDTLNRELTANKEANSAIGAWISGAKQKALDADDHGAKGILVDVGGHTGLNYKTLKANIESAQKGDQAAMDYLISKGFSNTIDVQEEFLEEYDVTRQVGTGILGADGNEIMRTVTEKATRPATRTVQKTVADWQSAFALLSDVEDKQVNEHMYRIASDSYTDVNGNEQKGGSTYDGANYDKYERATHAMKGLSAKNEDGETMYNIEFTVGNTDNELLKTSKKMAGATTDNQRHIEQNPTFEAAKVDAKEAKK